MNRDVVLVRVATLHALFLGVLAAALVTCGLPVKGALLGGSLAGISFVTFWVVARSIIEPRKKSLALWLGGLKILLYLVLTGLVLGGRLTADPRGFALGVTCFVAAAIGAALAWTPHSPGRQTSDAGGA